MKMLPVALVASALLLAGCGEKATQKTNQAVNAVSNVVDAPLNYVGAVVDAKKSSEKKIDVAYINQALQMFNVQEGHYPKTLQELTPNYIGKIAELPIGYKLDYDAVKGEVKIVAN